MNNELESSLHEELDGIKFNSRRHLRLVGIAQIYLWCPTDWTNYTEL